MNEKQIRHVVLDNWEAFKLMGWRSPSQAIAGYKAKPSGFEDDLVELRRYNGAQSSAGTAPPNLVEDSHKLNRTIGSIKNLASCGYTPEQIQQMVPEDVDHSGWSLNSIMRIARKEFGLADKPDLIQKWSRDYGRGLGTARNTDPP